MGLPTRVPGLALMLLCACGGAQTPTSRSAAASGTAASRAAEGREAAATPTAAAVSARASEGTIARAELLPVLDAGLGYFLRGVRVEASLEGGAFEGYRLTHLYPDDPRFQAIDLRPGDVVTRVNRRPIERPEQAQLVWDELRVASQLLVEYRRDGQDRALRFAIVD